MSQDNTQTQVQEKKPKKRPKWLEFLIYIVDGFIMGLANVIPGVSGGTLALILGVYEKLINSISNLFKKFGQSIFFLLPVIIGVILAFLGGSRAVTYCMRNFLFATILLFFGAVIGGLPMLFRKVKSTKVKPIGPVICFITFAITIGLLFVFQHQGTADVSTITFGRVILWLILGAVAAATMVIPGVSGSAFLMTVGYYYPVMNCVSDLTRAGANKGHAVAVLIIWAIGILLGIFGISKLIKVLLEKYETNTYWGIIGFVIGSAILIILQNFFMQNMVWVSPAVTIGGTSVIEYIVGIILAVAAFFGAYKLGDK